MGEQISDDRVGKESHTAVGMMDHKKFLRSQKLVGNYQGSNRIITGATTCIPDHMRITFS